MIFITENVRKLCYIFYLYLVDDMAVFNLSEFIILFGVKIENILKLNQKKNSQRTCVQKTNLPFTAAGCTCEKDAFTVCIYIGRRHLLISRFECDGNSGCRVFLSRKSDLLLNAWRSFLPGIQPCVGKGYDFNCIRSLSQL